MLKVKNRAVSPAIKRTASDEETATSCSVRSSGGGGTWAEEPPPPSPPRKGGEYAELDFDRIRRFLGRCYAGTGTAEGEPSVGWLLDHVDESSTPPKGDSMDEGLVTFLISFPLYDIFNSGKAIVLAKKNERRDIVSAVVVCECDPSSAANATSSFLGRFGSEWNHSVFVAKLAMQQRNVPDLFTSRKRRGERDALIAKGRALTSQSPRWRERYGPAAGGSNNSNSKRQRQRRYLHVSFVGTDPSERGLGFGSEMMGKVNDMADRSGLDCYLECRGKRNLSFFMMCGYRVAGEESVSDPAAAAASRGGGSMSGSSNSNSNNTITTYIMLRRAQRRVQLV